MAGCALSLAMISSGRCLLSGQGGELQDHADRERVEVRVQEPAPVHATGTAEDLDVDTLTSPHAEPLVDHVAWGRAMVSLTPTV
jgi:hypothetical protein